MKLNITTKLFLAVLFTSMLVALAIGISARISFTRGFLGYINEQGLEYAEKIIPTLETAYQEHGGWDFLRDNPREWFHIIRPKLPPLFFPDEPPPHGAIEPDLTGINLRVALLDAERQIVIGPPHIKELRNAVTLPIAIKGKTVGWLAIIPFEQVTAGADIRFQKRQLQSIWIIGIFSILLAGIVAMLLARLLLRPLKHIATATHHLAAGDYTARVEIVSHDETGRLAEDFNKLALALQKNEQIRRTFMADISHELRTPLAILRGEIEAIQDDIRPLSKESIKSLHVEVEILNKLVNDIYDLSLSDVGALSYRKGDVDVADELRTTMVIFQKRFSKHNIELETNITEKPLIVLGDESRLQQLFFNLTENIIRYTNHGGRCKISCQREDNSALIQFMDSEPGIPEEQLSYIFDRFFRIENTQSNSRSGSGLGLAICRNIVEAHGGHIAARSSPLGGLWIVVHLPLM